MADTWMLEFYFKSDLTVKDDPSMVFIGGCNMPFKLTTLPDNKNKWLCYQLNLHDTLLPA